MSPLLLCLVPPATSDVPPRYSEAYTNPNLTTWTGSPDTGGYNQPFPKNSFLGQC